MKCTVTSTKTKSIKKFDRWVFAKNQKKGKEKIKKRNLLCKERRKKNIPWSMKKAQKYWKESRGREMILTLREVCAVYKRDICCIVWYLWKEEGEKQGLVKSSCLKRREGSLKPPTAIFSSKSLKDCLCCHRVRWKMNFNVKGLIKKRKAIVHGHLLWCWLKLTLSMAISKKKKHNKKGGEKTLSIQPTQDDNCNR
jgi:hypothetical protein